MLFYQVMLAYKWCDE